MSLRVSDIKFNENNGARGHAVDAIGTLYD